MASHHGQKAYKISDDSHPVIGQKQDYLIQTGIEMSDMLRSTLGPNGMDKLFIDSDGMTIVSNRGSTILGEMHAESNINPAGEMFFTLADAQQSQLGDGATTGVIVAGELLREAKNLQETGIHPTTIADGYQQAARESEDALRDLVTHVTPSDTEQLEDVARSSIRGMGSQSCLDALPPLLVDAAVELHNGNGSPRDLTIEKSVGGTIYDSILMRGQVLLQNEPDMPGMPTHFDGATIACVGPDVAHPAERGSKEPLDIQDMDELETIESYQDNALAQLVDKLRACDVNVVLVSGSIASSVQKALSNEGILTISQLTDEKLEKVAGSTGAMALPALPEVSEETVGSAGLVEQRIVSGTRAIAIQDAAETEQLSLILRGEIEHLVDEVERAVRKACIVLETVLEDPYVLPGAGAPEIATAQHIREKAKSIDTRTQIVFHAYADAIETIPYELAKSAGLDPMAAIMDLRAAHTEGDSSTGIDVEAGGLYNSSSAGHFDVMAIKQQTFEAATATASRLLRIDEFVPANDLSDTVFGVKDD